MEEKKIVPARQVRHEIEVRRSRFIATLAPASSADQAKSFIGDVRSEFSDATHNVPAYLIGHGSTVTAHCNDDGEPAGTAGRPMLAVLKGSGLGDVAAVVTRYYGGVKLGTGGLVRAYSECVRQALERLPRAQKIATHRVEVDLPYPVHQPFKQILPDLQAQVLQEDFSDNVTLRLCLPVSRFADLQRRLADLTAGSTKAQIVETVEDDIVPTNDR
ncbi:MAG TPA: YigZ family protein [Acidobacteriota bacterium]|nr:YigZ family protein [Acidobacteriota bacterium]